MLEIKDLHVSVAGEGEAAKPILKGIDLSIPAGAVHAIMGPNGSGKSTLSHVLAGRDGYTVERGSVTFDGRDLLALAPEERAAAGVFLAFQYPVEIPGVPTTTFLKTALNAVRVARGDGEIDTLGFMKLLRSRQQALGISADMVKRPVNVGFSGGEKKRMEMLQLALLEPKLAILDETDSGLDIDALKTVADGINAGRAPGRAILMITHYQRLLNLVRPDVVHVLANGRIIASGGLELAERLEAEGYAGLLDAAA